MSKAKQPMKYFECFSDAFSYCREANHPVKVAVGMQIYKLFPSGRADEVIPRNAGEAWKQVDAINQAKEIYDESQSRSAAG